VRVLFGFGRVAVSTATIQGVDTARAVVFFPDEGKGVIGEALEPRKESVIQAYDDPIQLVFYNPESAQVVIGALEKIKAEMIKAKEKGGGS